MKIKKRDKMRTNAGLEGNRCGRAVLKRRQERLGLAEV
jgi:hypothetical protein